MDIACVGVVVGEDLFYLVVGFDCTKHNYKSATRVGGVVIVVDIVVGEIYPKSVVVVGAKHRLLDSEEVGGGENVLDVVKDALVSAVPNR